MAEFAIRVPGLDYLLDPYSAEPLERRPLTDEIRERIFDVWVDTRDERPRQLTVELPRSCAGRGSRTSSSQRYAAT